MNTLLRISCLLVALTLVAGCGNKGPLVLAEPPQAESVDTPAGEVPVELAPEAAAAAATDPATSPTTDSLDDTGTGTTEDTPAVGADPAEPPTPVPGRG